MPKAKTNQQVYELSLNVRVEWQAHSLSNAGSKNSNRLFPRQQLLADGTETDAYSGAIAKHWHASLMAEYLERSGFKLCKACSNGDPRRAAANESMSDPSMDELLSCGICDTHGFMIPAKNGPDGERKHAARSKNSIIEFSMALAMPEQHALSEQLFTRRAQGNEDDGNNGQMIFKMSARSGQYALCVRYKGVNIGVDTNTRRLVLEEEEIRLGRHQAILRALRDQILSPSGAMTAKLLPHLTGLSGAIVVRSTAGRAPMYSPLEPNFIDILTGLAAIKERSIKVLPFASAVEFNERMEQLINHSTPAQPTRKSQRNESDG